MALYQVAADVGGPALIKRINQRSRKTVEAMLETASDLKSPPDKFAIDIMLSAMAGGDAFLAGSWTIPCNGPQGARANGAPLSVIHDGRDSETRLEHPPRLSATCIVRSEYGLISDEVAPEKNADQGQPLGRSGIHVI